MMRETVDPNLAAHYRDKLVRGVHYQGFTTLAHADSIGRLITKYGATRLLDYGCGAGKQYTERGMHDAWGVPMPTLYDPSCPAFHQKPAGTFEGVICVDVLEHIPKRLVVATLKELHEYAERFLYLSICCRPSSKTLADGRNEHVTVCPPAWWLDLIAARKRPGLEVVIHWSQ